ncbi:MAG: hypothetical protein ABIA59_03030 [Candidatus Latescibacterota bacterium]
MSNKTSLKWRRKLLIFSAILALLILCSHIASWIYRQRDYTLHFSRQKGVLTSVKETPLSSRSGTSLSDIELVNDRRITVRGYIQVPTEGSGPYPVLVLLGGVRTGKHVIDYVGGMNQVILLGLDYPYEGKNSKMSTAEFLKNMPGMRRAVMNTVPAVLLAMDYLFDRDDVDTDRITLIGGSIGALFVPAAVASDMRITAAAILFGAGDVQSLIAANVDMPAPIPSLAAWLGGLLVSPLEPLKYINRISPRPLFMLNGTDDPRMPERCSRLLHDKAMNPKTIEWIPSGHIHIRSNEFQAQVRVILEKWLIKNRRIAPDTADVAPDPADG